MDVTLGLVADPAERAPLLEELRSSFYRVGQALASSLNLEETLRLIADAAADIMRAHAATVHLLDGERHGLVLKAASGLAQETLGRLQMAETEALIEGTARHRQSVQVPDLADDDRLALLALVPGREIRAYLAVPLMLRGQVMGVLAIGRRKAGAFSTSEVELLSSFASQASVAIENARLFAALQEKLREMSGLYEVSLAFGAMTRLEDTYGEIVGRISALLDVERCAILLPDESSEELIAQPQAVGLDHGQVASLRLSLAEDNASRRVWETGRPYLSNSAQTDSRNTHRFARAFGDRSLLVVPMVVEGKTIGLLRASNKRSGRFTNNDVRLATIFATQAAVVLRSAILYREVAQERQRLRAIFDNASDGIAIIDQDRRIVAMNAAMERLTGWRADEAVGACCEDVYQSHDEKGLSYCSQACPLPGLLCSRGAVATPTSRPGPGASEARLGTMPYVETIITTRDGKERDVAVSYSPISVGLDGDSPSGQVVAIIRDISRAKEVERAKTQFVSTVSHELRTPLASIKASVGVLLASMPEDTPEPIMRLLRNVDRSALRLESIVLDLLDLARLQSGRVRLSRRQVDLAEVASEALATIKPLADEKSQTLSLVVPARATPVDAPHPHVAVDAPHPHVTVNADRQRLGQVLLNLLSNAHKYTQEGGQITVRLARRGREVVCSVQDSGPGIPPEEQDRIFERFYRPENGVTQANVGTGLGLPIARALVELHGGRIWVRSTVGLGSTFYFSIPREPSQEPDEEPGRAGD